MNILKIKLIFLNCASKVLDTSFNPMYPGNVDISSNLKFRPMKKNMKKVVTMLALVMGFSVIALANIWIPWEMWEIKGQDPCKNGFFVPDGGEKFIDHIPSISGNCICDPGYWGPLCEFELED